MKRSVLGFVCAATALGVGIYTCFLQADNFDEGARLQGLQVELEWYERRISGLRSEISRFEFDEQTRNNQDPSSGDGGAKSLRGDEGDPHRPSGRQGREELRPRAGSEGVQ